MKRLRPIIIFFIYLNINVTPIVYAQENSVIQKKPDAWILYQKGIEYYNKKEYGLALKFFRDALDKKRGIFPEAEEAMGDIFRSSNMELAIFHYNRALQYKNAFNIPDERYRVLYKIASLYKLSEKYNKMEETYRKIVKDDPYYSDSKYEKMKTSIYSNFINKGLDQVLTLYRFSQAFSLEAHRELGYFYYKTGRYREAVKNLLYTTINIFTVTVEQILKHQPDFEFVTTAATVNKATKYQYLTTYLNRNQLFKVLYYLALAAYAHGNPAIARETWKIVATQNISIEYRNRAIRQLKSPWREPLLYK